MAYRPFFGNLIEPGGDPATGAKLSTYIKNTSTPLPMFTDSAGAVPATNPIIADADGRFRVYFNDALNYTVQARTSDGATAILEADITAGVISIDFIAGQLWHSDWSQPLSEPLSWTDQASAATVTLADVEANNIRITGTTTITAFGAASDGTRKVLRFADKLTLTHNATSLIMPEGMNVITEAGDVAVFVSEGGSNWRCISYLRARPPTRLNILDFGARNTGNTAHRSSNNNAFAAAIAAVVAAGSGVIYVPRGEYQLSATINLPDYCTLEGDGYFSILNFGTLGGSGHTGAGIDLGNNTIIAIRDIHVTQATGDGISSAASGGSNPHEFGFERVWSRYNGGHGFNLDDAYAVRLGGCVATNNTSNGFNLPGFHTSLSFDQCQASTNGGKGYSINDAVYLVMQACGSDDNTGSAYYFTNIGGGVVHGCGSERNAKGFVLEASNALIASATADDINGLAFIGCFGVDNTSTSFLEATSSDSRPIKFTFQDCNDLNSIGGTSVSLSGSVTAVRIGGTFEGSVSVSGAATINYIGGTTPAANKFEYFDSASTKALGDVTSDARSLLADSSVPRLGQARTWTAAQTHSADIEMSGGANIELGDLNSAGELRLRTGFAVNASGGSGLKEQDHSGGNSDGLGIYGHDGVSIWAAQTKQINVTNGVVTFPTITTTASAANAFLDNGASNSLLRSTSSLRYKSGIEDADGKYADALMEVRPVWYRSTSQADNPDWGWFGFIAEEVAVELPQLVHWSYLDTDYELVTHEVEIDVVYRAERQVQIVGEDGKLAPQTLIEEMPGKKTVQRTRRELKPGAVKVPDGVQYERFTVLHHLTLQRQAKRIKELEELLVAVVGE